MIPLRITLTGFMSYRDETVLSFDGAPLWMLAGPNGAGKSAVFDAITYALYDYHRLGGKHHAELIHKHADSMCVEFEFACGDDVYCVKRTNSRKGRPSREVLHVRGPHAPNPKKQGRQLVPETGTQKGFERWRAETIGLSYETFTASVLLCQGKSEALLEAEPAARHEMLSQIVDLSAYQRLHDEADKQQKRFEGEASAFQNQLRTLAPVEERELAELAERIAAANTAMESSQRQLRHLAALKVHARRWAALNGEQTQIQAGLNAARDLLARSEEIVLEAKRLDELTTVVPLLDALLLARDRLHKTEQAIAGHVRDSESLLQRIWEIKATRAEQEGIVEDLRARQEELANMKRKAQEILLAFGPPMAQIEGMDQVQEQLSDVDRVLTSFAADLGTWSVTLADEVDTLTELKQVVLPWLRRFVGARACWRDAQKGIEAAQHRLEEIRVSLPPDVAALGIASAAAWAEHAQDEVTRAQTLLDQEQKRLERLHQVEGKPTCSYCGQELRPEHIAAERGRIESAIQQAQSALDQAKDTHKRATKLKKAERNAEEGLQTAQTESRKAGLDGKDALAVLPEAYRVRIAPLPATDAANWFSQDYPSDGEIERLSAQADQINVVKQSLNQIRIAETGLRRETGLRQDRARDAAEKLAAVPTAWRHVCPSLTVDQVVALKQEAEALSGADDRYRELVQARDERAGREQRLAQIAGELTQIPEEARRPVECLEEQERLEERCFKVAHDEQQKATTSRQELLERRERRADLADKHKDAARQARLFGLLARLLGRDYLQRHLLQRAEMGIVYYANQTLDRISGGTLRMALRQSETAEDQSAGKGAAKALDLVAYKKDVGNSPLLVGALSGSQRFRVAVSLALGIGEYASQGARRNQSVIIDEGFGSLDQQGRHDMIQELHALKSVLRRILVVSHQEEFFNAFSRGYRIELVDGTSRVSDLEVASVGGLAVELEEPVLLGIAG